ncbi:trigger factor [Geothrix edaphica]|uniref:Trigger factor n=1 Tax=Geothrix edaphica TaxID=2927976 RepID=A0ABQ5Q080_9BACT|nr:trigger factor [Geothrix edaphica]GLH68028.1 trigger factor [Geothrix edaphica]
MSATLHHQSPTRKAVEVTVPAAEVSATFNEVVAKIAPKVRIPGFRPGKAPRPVLMQRYAREIQSDVAQQLVEKHFWKAAQEAGAMPISHPSLEKLDLKEGADAVFRAQFDVAPEVVLPDYKTMVLTKKKRAIDEATVAEHLEGLRQRATKLLPIEDGAVAQDLVVTCDIRVKPQGLKAQTYQDQVLKIDGTRPFDAQLLGMKIDEKKAFNLTHPADDTNQVLAGKTLAYEVQVKDIRRQEVPVLGDDFAKDMGTFENLEALKTAVQKDLEEAADRDAVARLHATMLDTLLDAAPFEVPRSMVALQLDDYCQEFAQHVARQGMDPKKVNWQAYRQYRMNDAERAVRSGYLLQAIGNTEAIEVPEADIDAEIRTFMAENQVQQPFEAFKAELERRGNTTEIKGRLRTDRIFTHLLATATVTEELLDKAAFEALVELERKREAGIPVNRFDAGGLEGGDLEGQEGGEPAAVAPAGHVHGPDCDHDHDHEAEAKPAKKAPKAKPEAEPAKDAVKKAEPVAEEKPKKAAAKKEEPAAEKPKKAPAKKEEPAAEEKPKAKKPAAKK